MHGFLFPAGALCIPAWRHRPCLCSLLHHCNVLWEKGHRDRLNVPRRMRPRWLLEQEVDDAKPREASRARAAGARRTQAAWITIAGADAAAGGGRRRGAAADLANRRGSSSRSKPCSVAVARHSGDWVRGSTAGDQLAIGVLVLPQRGPNRSELELVAGKQRVQHGRRRSGLLP